MSSEESRYFGIDDNHRHQNDWDIAHPVELQRDQVLLSIDTNVLLNLYKVSGPSLEIFAKVLRELRDRELLFVTDETIREFWKGRPGVIESSRNSFSKTRGYLTSSRDMLEKTMDAMAEMDSKYGADTGSDFHSEAETWLQKFDSLLDGVRGDIADIEKTSPAILSTSVDKDPVVALLRDVLQGNVGPALTDDGKREEHFKMAKNAAASGRAPGATDKDKIKKSDLGDFLIWQQILDRVKADDRSKLKTVLVTAEKKWDWWRSENPVEDVNRKENDGKRVGAHLDLIEDYTSIRPEGMIYIWDVEQLVTGVDREFNLNLDEKAVKAAVNQSVSREDTVPVTLRAQGITRRGNYNPVDGTLKVAAGTVMRGEQTESNSPTAKKLRESLLLDEIAVWDDSKQAYVFTEDYEFSSPSTAASVLAGASRSWIVWKTEDGVSLRDHMLSLDDDFESEESE